jgi:hypothetical protein
MEGLRKGNINKDDSNQALRMGRSRRATQSGMSPTAHRNAMSDRILARLELEPIPHPRSGFMCYTVRAEGRS